jgi:hypothetical protein
LDRVGRAEAHRAEWDEHHRDGEEHPGHLRFVWKGWDDDARVNGWWEVERWERADGFGMGAVET